MKLVRISLITALTFLIAGCMNVGPVKMPQAAVGFAPKKTYSVAYATAWQKVQLTLENSRITILSANKDESIGRIQTDYIEGASTLIAGGLVGAQSTRYRYSITMRPDGDKTNIGVVCKVESTINGGNGASPWTDVSGQNAKLLTQLENWLYEQIEKDL